MRARSALLLLVAPLGLSLAACNGQRAAGGPPTQLAALTPGTIPANRQVMELPAPAPYFAPGAERDREWMKLAPTAKMDPALARTEVDYSTAEKPGTIIVSTPERRLYYVLPNGRALRYAVSVGREGASWSGTANVDRKLEWPDWNPPKEMIARAPNLPDRMQGGPLNPIGSRSLYLAQGKKDTLYRIHGTNEPDSIGKDVSSGCIRMWNEDAMDLYNRVPIGTKVVVL